MLHPVHAEMLEVLVDFYYLRLLNEQVSMLVELAKCPLTFSKLLLFGIAIVIVDSHDC